MGFIDMSINEKTIREDHMRDTNNQYPFKYDIHGVEILAEVELRESEIRSLRNLKNIESWSNGAFGRSETDWPKWINPNPVSAVIVNHLPEFKRIPLEYLPREIGTVSDEKELPPPASDSPYTSDDPGHVYKVDDSIFEEAEEVLEIDCEPKRDWSGLTSKLKVIQMENRLCTCGCAAKRHEIEPPYPCYECECRFFEDAIVEKGGQ